MKLRYYYLLILFSFGACDDGPTYPDEPAIEFLSVSKTELIEQPDSVRVELSFTDGDGDLGFQSYDTASCNLCDQSCLTHPSFSIFVNDSRTPNCLTPFNVPYVPYEGINDAISGKVSIVLSTCCIINDYVCPTLPDTTSTVVYTIQLKDRAGNLSNKIQVPPIRIHCN